MAEASLTMRDHMNVWLAHKRDFVRENWDLLKNHIGDNPVIIPSLPSVTGGSSGIIGYEFGIDEDGDEYIVLGFMLPDGVYVEIDESCQYSKLTGFRIYRDDLED